MTRFEDENSGCYLLHIYDKLMYLENFEKDVPQICTITKSTWTFNLNECSILSSDSHSQLQVHAHAVNKWQHPNTSEWTK